MAHFVEGALNAYYNSQVNIVRKDLEAKEIGESSVLGYRGWIPSIQKFVGGITVPFQVAWGFVAGAEKDKNPLIEFPESSKNSEYTKDIQKYADLKAEAIAARVDSLGLKVGGIFGLNPSKFSDGMLADKNAQHIDTKADKVILPMRSEQKETQIVAVIPPTDLPMNHLTKPNTFKL